VGELVKLFYDLVGRRTCEEHQRAMERLAMNLHTTDHTRLASTKAEESLRTERIQRSANSSVETGSVVADEFNNHRRKKGPNLLVAGHDTCHYQVVHPLCTTEDHDSPLL
jgi:hypothetical protein